HTHTHSGAKRRTSDTARAQRRRGERRSRERRRVGGGGGQLQREPLGRREAHAALGRVVVLEFRLQPRTLLRTCVSSAPDSARVQLTSWRSRRFSSFCRRRSRFSSICFSFSSSVSGRFASLAAARCR